MKAVHHSVITISQIFTRTSALTCLLTRAHALTPFQIGGEVHPLVEGARQHRTAAGRHTSGGAGSEDELGHYILNAHGVNKRIETGAGFLGSGIEAFKALRCW